MKGEGEVKGKKDLRGYTSKGREGEGRGRKCLHMCSPKFSLE